MVRDFNFETRFWSRVAMAGPNECWPWQGYCAPKGYGYVRWKGRPEPTHRVAFELQWGVDLSSWLFVLHDCPGGDNPICCNPNHFKIGTHADNMKDRDQKGRTVSGDRHWTRRNPEKVARGDDSWARQHLELVLRGENQGNSKLNWGRVEYARARYALGGVSHRQLGNLLRVSRQIIGQAIRFETWIPEGNEPNEEALLECLCVRL